MREGSLIEVSTASSTSQEARDDCRSRRSRYPAEELVPAPDEPPERTSERPQQPQIPGQEEGLAPKNGDVRLAPHRDRTPPIASP
jgi:hypothetical protein